jgi:predicted MFS family arabinose efflux permease
LGILISTQLNWRVTFLLVALLGVIAFVGVLTLFPTVANPSAVNLRTRLALLRQPAIVILSLNGSALYLGIGTGAALGGLVVQSLSLSALGWVGAVFELLALVVLRLSVWLMGRAARQTVQEVPL